MPTALDSVTADAMKLSPEDRAELIERLTDPVLPNPPLHPDWQAEIARRVAEMDAGVTQFIPADQAMAELHAHILSRQPK
ncbi:MAG: addiction module protein [Burkholderiaceae bacterium]|nr:addiction module protein [Burkholderiaceae bacterium]